MLKFESNQDHIQWVQRIIGAIIGAENDKFT